MTCRSSSLSKPRLSTAIIFSLSSSAMKFLRRTTSGLCRPAELSGCLGTMLRRRSRMSFGASPASRPRRHRKVARRRSPRLCRAAGGVGNSTLAVEAAVQLKTTKATRERSVCLIDLDFQNSHVCDYLDIEPRLQIQELAENPGRLDAQLLALFLSQHSSGVDVLASPRSKASPLDFNVAALDMLF